METKLTSVKVIKDLYSQFKKVTLDGDNKVTLQQLVNRSLTLFVNDDMFRENIIKYDNLQIVSGSQF